IALGTDRLQSALNIEKTSLPHDPLAPSAHYRVRSPSQIRGELARGIFRGARTLISISPRRVTVSSILTRSYKLRKTRGRNGPGYLSLVFRRRWMFSSVKFNFDAIRTIYGADASMGGCPCQEQRGNDQRRWDTSGGFHRLLPKGLLPSTPLSGLLAVPCCVL